MMSLRMTFSSVVLSLAQWTVPGILRFDEGPQGLRLCLARGPNPAGTAFGLSGAARAVPRVGWRGSCCNCPATGQRGWRPQRRLTETDPGLVDALDALVEPATRDPITWLRWTTRSTRNLAAELRARRHAMSHHSVARPAGR
jgi:hypothetical protein